GVNGRRFQGSSLADAHLGAGEAIAEFGADTVAAFKQARESGASELSQEGLHICFRRIGTKAQPAIVVLVVEEPASPRVAEEVKTETSAGVETMRARAQPAKAPTRFVWQTDAAGRFASVSGDLSAMVGGAAAE